MGALLSTIMTSFAAGGISICTQNTLSNFHINCCNKRAELAEDDCELAYCESLREHFCDQNIARFESDGHGLVVIRSKDLEKFAAGDSDSITGDDLGWICSLYDSILNHQHCARVVVKKLKFNNVHVIVEYRPSKKKRITGVIMRLPRAAWEEFAGDTMVFNKFQ
jgi:hypothetical protein